MRPVRKSWIAECQDVDAEVDGREERGLCSPSANAMADDPRLLKIKDRRGDREQQHEEADIDEVARAEGAGDAGKDAAADRRFVARGRGRPAMQRRREARQSADAEHRDFEQDRGAEQQKNRRDVAREARGNARSDDRADRSPGGNQAEQPLALLGAEQVDVQLPEHRNDEQIVDRDPDEKDAPDPHRVLRIPMKKCGEHQDIEGEEMVGDRDEAATRQFLDEKGERDVQQHHAEEGAGE